MGDATLLPLLLLIIIIIIVIIITIIIIILIIITQDIKRVENMIRGRAVPMQRNGACAHMDNYIHAHIRACMHSQLHLRRYS